MGLIDNAHDDGVAAALDVYGVKTAGAAGGLLRRGVGMLGKVLSPVAKVVGIAPGGFNNLIGAGIGALGGAASAYANDEDWKGYAARMGTGAVAGALPFMIGLPVGMAADSVIDGAIHGPKGPGQPPPAVNAHGMPVAGRRLPGR